MVRTVQSPVGLSSSPPPCLTSHLSSATVKTFAQPRKQSSLPSLCPGASEPSLPIHPPSIRARWVRNIHVFIKKVCPDGWPVSCWHSSMSSCLQVGWNQTVSPPGCLRISRGSARLGTAYASVAVAQLVSGPRLGKRASDCQPSWPLKSWRLASAQAELVPRNGVTQVGRA